MLNTKYFIAPGQNGQPVAQQNPDYAGNAWFVSKIKWEADEQAELNALAAFDPKREVILNEQYRSLTSSLNIQKDSLGNDVLLTNGSIQLSEYTPKRLTYTSNTSIDQLAVFSEIFYDTDGGWQAYIDGEKADHLRVNYLLRGMVIPAGQHEIKFVFEPQTYLKAERTSLALMGLLALVILGSLFMAWKNSSKEV